MTSAPTWSLRKVGTWLGTTETGQSASRIFRSGCKDRCDLGCDWLPV